MRSSSIGTPKSLGRVLIDLRYIRERDLVRALAEQVRLEFVDLTEFRIDDRHRETAMIAAESALTGHLVLSSLHKNDAPSAITPSGHACT